MRVIKVLSKLLGQFFTDQKLSDATKVIEQGPTKRAALLCGAWSNGLARVQGDDQSANSLAKA